MATQKGFLKACDTQGQLKKKIKQNMEIIALGGSVVEKQHENRSLKLMGNLGIYSGMRVY